MGTRANGRAVDHTWTAHMSSIGVIGVEEEVEEGAVALVEGLVSSLIASFALFVLVVPLPMPILLPILLDPQPAPVPVPPIKINWGKIFPTLFFLLHTTSH